MKSDTDIAIIGAGPYGLSLAAHLRERGTDFRIFGRPMNTWRTQMLSNSHLKSDGFASSLYEPSRSSTLKAYCLANGLPYSDMNLPVPRRTFVEYALDFQRRHVPQVEARDVTRVHPQRGGFAVELEDGERLFARRVVVATGISRFAYLPPVLDNLPVEALTHSSAHTNVEHLAGKHVAIVGAGASAFDFAKECVLAGSPVTVIARRAKIDFHNPPRPRSWIEQLRAPNSGLGPGWRSRLATDAPLVFSAMPERFRIEVVRKHLGPAPCWFAREAVEGVATILTGRQVEAVVPAGDRVRLRLAGGEQSNEQVEVDHVVAATGYRVDLRRLAFLPAAVRSAIRLCDTSPALSINFESSVPGLYFIGTPAANTFGPVSRFAFGANFTANRLSRHLASAVVRPRGALVPQAA